VGATALTYVNLLALSTGEAQQFFAGQEIVDDTVGALQDGLAFEREQAGITRPGANEVNLPD
jgi:hypothetical protein